MIRKILCLAAALFWPRLLWPHAGRATRQAACGRDGVDADVLEERGVAAGQISLLPAADGTHWSRMSFNLRGFVTEIDEQNRFAPDGTLASMVVRGKNPQGDAGETYDVKDGTYTYQTPVDHGTGKASPNLAYVAFGGTFDSFTFLLDAMLKSPSHGIDLLPSGHGVIAPLTTLDISNERARERDSRLRGRLLRPVAVSDLDGRQQILRTCRRDLLPAPGLGERWWRDEQGAGRCAREARASAIRRDRKVARRPGRVQEREALRRRCAQIPRRHDGRGRQRRRHRCRHREGHENPRQCRDHRRHRKDPDPRPLGQSPALWRRFHRAPATCFRHHERARSRQSAGRADGAQEAHRRPPAPRPAHRAVAADRRSRPLYGTGRRGRSQCRRGARRREPRQGFRLFRHQTLRLARSGLGRADGERCPPVGPACPRTHPARNAAARRGP